MKWVTCMYLGMHRTVSRYTHGSVHVKLVPGTPQQSRFLSWPQKARFLWVHGLHGLHGPHSPNTNPGGGQGESPQEKLPYNVGSQFCGSSNPKEGYIIVMSNSLYLGITLYIYWSSFLTRRPLPKHAWTSLARETLSSSTRRGDIHKHEWTIFLIYYNQTRRFI